MTHALNRITWTILASGAVITGLAFLIGGQAVGVGAASGTVVATLNWFVIQRLVGMAFAGSGRGTASVTILFVVKMAALFALCYWLLAIAQVDPLGFSLGMSALVVGILVGSPGVAAQLDDSSADADGGTDADAREEG